MLACTVCSGMRPPRNHMHCWHLESGITTLSLAFVFVCARASVCVCVCLCASARHTHAFSELHMRELIAQALSLLISRSTRTVAALIHLLRSSSRIPKCLPTSGFGARNRRQRRISEPEPGPRVRTHTHTHTHARPSCENASSGRIPAAIWHRMHDALMHYETASAHSHPINPFRP